MASYSDAKSVHETLTGTTVDTVTLSQFWDAVEITNHDSSTPLYVRFDAQNPTSGGEGSWVVPRAASKTFKTSDGVSNWAAGVAGSTAEATAPIRVRIVGNNNAYSVEGSSL